MKKAFAVALATGLTALSASAAEPTKKPCTDMGRACLIEVARTYLDARTDNRVRHLQRVSPKLKRWENGIMTADSPADIIGPEGTGPSKIIVARDLDRVMVDGNQAAFFWILDKRDKPDGPFTATVHIFERFKFVNDKAQCGDVTAPCISEIEVVMCTSPHANGQALPEPKDPKWFSKFLCNREG